MKHDCNMNVYKNKYFLSPQRTQRRTEYKNNNLCVPLCSLWCIYLHKLMQLSALGDATICMARGTYLKNFD